MRLTIVREVLQGLGHAVAPSRCMKCLAVGVWLCPACRNRMQYTRLHCYCPLCGKKSPRGLTCTLCRAHTRLFGAVTAGSYHTAYLRRGIGWLKFKSITALARPLAELLVPALLQIAPLSTLVEQAVLVPIPLHKSKQRSRGFNQSQLLAEHLSRLTDIPLHNILYRTKATASQALLPTSLRLTNTDNAFATKFGVFKILSSYKYVILVDDVLTSAATMTAAAKVLPTDTHIIWAATVARG